MSTNRSSVFVGPTEQQLESARERHAEALAACTQPLQYLRTLRMQLQEHQTAAAAATESGDSEQAAQYQAQADALAPHIARAEADLQPLQAEADRLEAELQALGETHRSDPHQLQIPLATRAQRLPAISHHVQQHWQLHLRYQAPARIVQVRELLAALDDQPDQDDAELLEQRRALQAELSELQQLEPVDAADYAASTELAACAKAACIGLFLRSPKPPVRYRPGCDLLEYGEAVYAWLTEDAAQPYSPSHINALYLECTRLATREAEARKRAAGFRSKR